MSPVVQTITSNNDHAGRAELVRTLGSTASNMSVQFFMANYGASDRIELLLHNMPPIQNLPGPTTDDRVMDKNTWCICARRTFLVGTAKVDLRYRGYERHPENQVRNQQHEIDISIIMRAGN